MFEDFTDLQFADYLDRVANDLEESGYEAMPDDYREAATRIRDLTDEN